MFPHLNVPREQFFYNENREHVRLLDEAARRSGLSRGQVFDDFLHMGVCALSGGQLEDQYMQIVGKYSEGKKGKRACDTLAHLFGSVVNSMEDTRDGIRDVLGDLFQGGITYGENGQYLTPDAITVLMGQLTTGDEEGDGKRKSVCDPCVGSGRMLLSVAEKHRNWEFIGQDVDIRCVRMTAMNLALRNLYGWAIHGNSLHLEQKLVYRTGFNGRGFVREVPPESCPYPLASVSENQAPNTPREIAPNIEIRDSPQESDPPSLKQRNLFE